MWLPPYKLKLLKSTVKMYIKRTLKTKTRQKVDLKLNVDLTFNFLVCMHAEHTITVEGVCGGIIRDLPELQVNILVTLILVSILLKEQAFRCHWP